MYHDASGVITAKIKTTLIIVAVALVIIITRLAQLQIIQQRSLYAKSQNNFLRVETIAPLRGNILDRNGQLMATNRPTTNVFWHGTGNSKLTASQQLMLEKLETILNVQLLDNVSWLEELKSAERRYQKILIANDIPFEHLGQIAEQLSDSKNIVINTHFKRFYPHQSLASHVLGYLNRMDMEMFGKMGLEKICEDMLKGQKGERLKTINSIGRNLFETEIKKAAPGQSIQTTLDLSYQQLVEQVFPVDFTGTFIIMDPEDGSILALLSRPNFDPTLFLDPLQEDDWLSMQEKQPFLNRACNACYPPGSIFKLISVAAMLEHKIITMDQSWNCRGYVEFANRQYGCSNRLGHGLLNTEQSLAKSCNVLFFETAKKINIDLLADYAYRFGLGKKTNFIFAEKEGLVPTAAWKKRVKHEKWRPGETLSVAIGQSYTLVTPLQIAPMISSIFTGYLVKPRMLLDEPIIQERLAVSADVRKFLQQSMRQTVNYGTGQRASVKNMRVYAKTSTAQTSSLEKRDMGTEYLEHGWFVGYFEYKEQKPLTLVIMVEHCGTSRVATNIAAQFLSGYKKMVDQKTFTAV